MKKEKPTAIQALNAAVQTVYSWFWQPPIGGQPGLMMIVDNHPGPDNPEISFVSESLAGVLFEIESKLPNNIAFFHLRIYVRDPFSHWFRVIVNDSRRFRIIEAEVAQGDLHELWEARL